MILQSVRTYEINAYIFVYGISGLLQWLVVWQNTITKESCITIEGNCDNNIQFVCPNYLS